MSTLSWGSSVEFDSSEADEKSICRLTNTLFVIAFKDVSGSNKGKVIAGTISGTTVTISDDSASTFDVGQVKNIEIKRISDTKFIISYTDLTNANTAGVIGTVSGTTITLGTSYKIQDGTVADRAGGVAVLDSTYVVFGYYDGDNIQMAARIASVSGTVITLLGSSTSVDIDGGADGSDWHGSHPGKMATLDSTHVVFLYSYIYAEPHFGIKILEIDTGAETITVGARANDVMYFSCIGYSLDVFDSMYFIIGAPIVGAGSDYVRMGAVSGTTTITMGTEVEITTAASMAVFVLDSTHFGVAYYDTGDTDKGKVSLGSHSALVITIDKDAQQFEASDTDNLAACGMTNQLFSIAYKITP